MSEKVDISAEQFARRELARIDTRDTVQPPFETLHMGTPAPGGGGSIWDAIRVRMRKPLKRYERPGRGPDKEPDPTWHYAKGVAALVAGCAMPFFLPFSIVAIPSAFLIGFGATRAQIGVVRFSGMGMMGSFILACLIAGQTDNLWTKTLIILGSGGGLWGIPVLAAFGLGVGLAWIIDKR